jgi:hypothetical protein
MGLYLIYFIYSTVKSYTSSSNQNEQNDIIEDNIKNQSTFTFMQILRYKSSDRSNQSKHHQINPLLPSYAVKLKQKVKH